MTGGSRSTLPAALFDEILARFDGGHVAEAMDELMRRLDGVRTTLGRDAWRELVTTVCRAHPLARRVVADPFTRRSIEKPRGYAGDAVMLDFIYAGIPEPLRQEITEEGAQVFDATAHRAGASVAVRERRDLLAHRIDEAADRADGARVLSVACGHLREAGISRAAREGRLGELIALDQDAESLEVVRREHAGLPIVPVHAKIKALLEGTVRFSELDLVYSAGLYDYLEQRAATRLTATLFDTLKPGGVLLIGNFVPSFGAAGYAEAFMDWWLVCRDAEQLAATAATIDPERIASRRNFLGANGSVVYIELVRR